MSGIETIEIRVSTGDRQDGQWKPLMLSGERVGEHLAVTPHTRRREDGTSGFRGDWLVTHVPTGMAVPRTATHDVDEAREIAAALAAMDVDWSSDDPARYQQCDLSRRILAVIDSVLDSWLDS